MNFIELLGKIGAAVASGTSQSGNNGETESANAVKSAPVGQDTETRQGAATFSAAPPTLKTGKTKRETVEDMLRRHAAHSLKIDAASSAAKASTAPSPSALTSPIATAPSSVTPKATATERKTPGTKTATTKHKATTARKKPTN